MILAMVPGTLTKDPEQRTAQGSGKPFVTANIRVASDGEGGAMFVSVLAFGSAGAKLAALSAGEPVTVAGTLQESSWTGKDGQERRGWKLMASAVLTAHEAVRKRRAVNAAAASDAAVPDRFPSEGFERAHRPASRLPGGAAGVKRPAAVAGTASDPFEGMADDLPV